jgi:hypothetical protein
MGNINHEYVKDFILHPSQWADPTKLSDETLEKIKDRITQENAGRKKPLSADQQQKLVDKYSKEHIKAQTDAQNNDKLGRIADHIRIFSQGEKTFRSGQTKPEEVAKTTGEWTRAAWSTDFEPFHGGHGSSSQHPDFVAYHDAWKASGESIPHPDTLFGSETFHVEDAFEDVLPKELKKANKENKRKFDANVAIAREHMTKNNDELSSFRSTPFRMNESRKIYSKVKKLLNEESTLKSLPFEILGIDAPLDYGKTNFDPSMIGIYGRHVRPDGSRGPEVNIPVHAFTDMHHNDVIDHAEDYMRGKGKISPDNPLFKALNDQGGDSPSTFKVDPSKVESIESYNKRVNEEGL